MANPGEKEGDYEILDMTVLGGRTVAATNYHNTLYHPPYCFYALSLRKGFYFYKFII